MTTLAGTLRTHHRRSVRRRLLVNAVMATLIVALLFADLVTGPAGLAMGRVMDALVQGPSGAADHLATTVIWVLRLPMALMGVLVGAGLGMAGLEMQTILDNPLASPFTLGFSAAAGFGAALAIMFGAAVPFPGWLLAPAAAFAATLVACALLYTLARSRGASPETLVLGGIAIMFMFQACQSLLQYLAAPEVLQQIVFWLFGSLLKATWTSTGVVALALVVAVPWLVRDAWRLTALRLGDIQARSLGVDVDALRRRTFVLVAFITAAAVAFVGTIGFIGLVAPHAARALVGEDQRTLLPLSALIGAALLSGASVLSKLVGGGAAVPVGIVTALVGVPVLFALVMRRSAGAA